MGFSKGWQGSYEGNPEEKPCQPKENPVLFDYFTKIYILFEIGFTVSNAPRGSSKQIFLRLKL